MYTSHLTVDTRVKPSSGPLSAKSHSNKENLLLAAGSTSVDKQRSRSISNASASSSHSATTPNTASTSSSLAAPKPTHSLDSRARSPSPATPAADESSNGPEYVLAMHDYAPQHTTTTCLSFRAGQVIHVLNRDASGWWDGELEGRRGWFPSNFVNEDFARRSKEPVTQQQRPQHEHSQSTASSSSMATSYSRRQQHSRQSSYEGFASDAIHYSTPIMIPMIHGLSLLQHAVRANRVTHFQPSAACIIACVRRILNTTATINREAPILQRFPALAQERSKLLTTLAKLVTQARRASEENLPEKELEAEIVEMMKTGGLVFSHVRRFVAIAVQCGIELPQDAATAADGSLTTEAPTSWTSRDDAEEGEPTGRTPTQHGQWDKSKEATISVASMRAKSMADLRNGSSLHPEVPISKTLSGQPQQGRLLRERVLARHKAELSTSSTSSSSTCSSQESTSVLSSPPFPSGPTTSSRVLDTVRYTHDQYLSTIAAFIGHAHSHSRSSHASSTGHLYELTREIVEMVSKILTIVVAVMGHPDVPTHSVKNLKIANEALYNVTSVLAESVRMLTMPLPPSMSEQDEKAALIRSATGALRAGADCVAAVKVCLNRTAGDRPFIINLPYVGNGDETQESISPAESVFSGLNRSTSMSALDGCSRANVVADEEDATIQPQAIDTSSRTREMSSGSDNSSVESKTSWTQSVATTATTPEVRPRPAPLALSKEAVEPDFPSPASFTTRTDDDGGTTWEGSTRAHGVVSPIEENIDELPNIHGFNQDPSNWMVSRDYDMDDVAYNGEGHLVGATLEVLVEKMTPHDSIVDPAFAAVFFMTFRMFSSPLELVDSIIARYNLIPPRGISHEELQLWQQKKGLPVRLRVSNFIKLWVELYWRPGVDDVAIQSLLNFSRDALGAYFPGPASRILELLALRHQSSTLTISLKGDHRARDPGYSLNPPTMGLPTSEIPRPNMTKTLLVSLRKKEFMGISVLDFDTLELARQMTIMECTLYCAIQPEEILEAGQNGARSHVNVKAVTSLSTVITGWVAESILHELDLKKRTGLIKFFVKVADRCTSLHNYSTSRSILAALDSSTISRLHQTWTGVPQKTKTQLEALRKLADHGRNYHEYRSRLRNTAPPAVPFLGLYLTDVTFCREGNPSHRASPTNPTKKLLNFNKYHKLARIVQDMQRFQVPYGLKAIPEVQDYLNWAFEKSKHSGDFQDLYRRSLLVEPKQPADTPPTSDMRQLFNWATRSQSTTSTTTSNTMTISSQTQIQSTSSS